MSALAVVELTARPGDRPHLRQDFHICAGTVQALRAELERIGAGGGRDWSHITTQIGMFAFTGLSARQARGPAAEPCDNRSLASQLVPGACAAYGPIGPRALPTSTLQRVCTLPCGTTMPPRQRDRSRRLRSAMPASALPSAREECADQSGPFSTMRALCCCCRRPALRPRSGIRCFAWWFLAQVESLRKVEHVYLTSDGRMSLAGLAAKHVNYVAAGMARVTKELP